MELLALTGTLSDVWLVLCPLPSQLSTCRFPSTPGSALVQNRILPPIASCQVPVGRGWAIVPISLFTTGLAKPQARLA